MHEMTIAVELMRQLEALAAEHGVERIEEVNVAAGAMRQVVPDALELAFEILAEDTCAAGTRLNLEVTPVIARCRQCGYRFEPELDMFLCARCNQADVEIVEGDDIILTSVTCQQQDGARCDEDQRGT